MREDLTGKTYGRWTVQGPSEVSRYHWVTKCSCGTVKDVDSRGLKNGNTKSCGCLKAELEAAEDFTGRVFGRLTVLRRMRSKGVFWVCQCECGREKFISAYSLSNLATKSCGCLKKEFSLRGFSLAKSVPVI